MIVNINGMEPKIGKDCFVASTALISGQVEIGEKTNIWYNTVARGDVNTIKIGENSNIQDNCTLHSSVNTLTVIGDETVLGHNVIAHACSIGNNVLVGNGAIVLDDAVIEDNVIIGAGTVVPPGKVIKSNTVVMGNPYKVVRAFSESDRQMIQSILSRYSHWSQVYQDTAKEVKK